MRTVLVNHPAGPLPDGCELDRLISTVLLLFKPIVLTCSLTGPFSMRRSLRNNDQLLSFAPYDDESSARWPCLIGTSLGRELILDRRPIFVMIGTALTTSRQPDRARHLGKHAARAG